MYRCRYSLLIAGALAALIFIACTCPGCSGKSSSAAVPAASSGAAVPGRHSDTEISNEGLNHGQGRPRHYELQAYLQAEFQRLGIDPDKAVAAAPAGANNAVFDLALAVVDTDGEGGDPPAAVELSWTERVLGDYDQNGEVGVSDLTPLGAYWQDSVAYDDAALHDGIAYWPTGDPDADKSSSAAVPAASGSGGLRAAGLDGARDGAASGWEEAAASGKMVAASGASNWRLARVDGNANGLLEISDITTIGQRFKQRLDGYQIEHAVNLGAGVWVWDALPLDIGHGTAPSAPRSLTFPAGENAPDPLLPVRYHVTVPLADADHAQLYRVVPYDGQSQESGAQSNPAAYYPNGTSDTTPPVWVDTVGAVQLVPGYEQLTAHFGTAEDGQSPPVSYRVFWAEGDPEQPDVPFDYETADYADVDSAPYTITGLTNDQYYRVSVRAMDSATPANMELNMVVLGHYAGPADVYPPEWQGRIGIQELLYGDSLALVVFDAAVDNHTDEYGTWESGPVVYRVYYGEGEQPDWEHALTQDFVDIGLESYVVRISGLDTSVTRWFAVRARDQAEQVNEDTNSAIEMGYGSRIEDLEPPGMGPDLPVGAELIPYSGDFVASPDQNFVNLSYLSISPNGEAWASLYDCDEGGFVHLRDVHIKGDLNDVDQIEAQELDRAGKLVVLYITDSSLDGGIYKLYREATDQLEQYPIDGKSTDAAGLNYLSQPWAQVGSHSGDITDLVFSYYFAFLPAGELTPFWTTPDDREYRSLYRYYWYGTQPDGSIVMAFSSDKEMEPVRTVYIAHSEGNSLNLSPYEPPEEGTELAYFISDAQGQLITIERNNSVDGANWRRWSDSTKSVLIQECSPIEFFSSGRTNIRNIDYFAHGVSITIHNWYEEPGEPQYDMTAMYIFKDDKTWEIPLGELGQTLRFHSEGFRGAIFVDGALVQQYSSVISFQVPPYPLMRVTLTE